MPVRTLQVGEIETCCHIVSADEPDGGEKPCVVIDPGAEPGRIAGEARRLGLRVEAVFLTHAHADHIGGVAGILREWPEAVLMCSAETSRRAADPALNLSAYLGTPVSAPPAGRLLADGEKFVAAGMEWRAVEIPGHDPGEMAFILGDGGMTFVGDTVFAGSVGRSDFPGGDGEALAEGVRKLLESLPPDGALFPGHGPATDARTELAHNPFLRGGRS